MKINHTVLARVSSHRSGGRAKLLLAHPVFNLFTDKALTSNEFRNLEIGTLVVCRVTVTNRSRRQVHYVAKRNDINNKSMFLTEFRESIESSYRAHDRAYGTDFTETVLNPLMKRVGVAEEEAAPAPAPVVEEAPVLPVGSSIYIGREDQELLDTIHNISRNRHVAVMMIGPSGYGKTSIPQQKAKDWGMNFLRWDCATVRDPEEFFGFRGAFEGSTMTSDGDTLFTPSAFTKAIEAGNVVVVLDEINRIDPYISNILFPLLDHAGETEVAGHHVKLGPNVIFFATANIGYQFTGTFGLDTALTNRFIAKVRVGALPREVEVELICGRTGLDRSNASTIVKVCQSLRKLNETGHLTADASTRVSLQVGDLVKHGLSVRQAFIFAVVNGLSDEEARVAVDAINLTA